MAPRSVEKAAGAAVASLAGGLYLNHRYGFYKDIKGLVNMRRSQDAVQKRIETLGNHVTVYRMVELCEPNAEALWFEGRTWTYAQLKLDVDKFATIIEQYDIIAGDSVAVFTTNSPEMVIAYIALSRVGAVPALINTSLRLDTLSHCLNIAKAKLLICTPDLAPAVLELYNNTPSTTPSISFNLSSFPPLQLTDQTQLDRIKQVRYEDLCAVEPSTTPLPKRSITDSGCLIYTSGTSGKPKAVNIKNILPVVVSTGSVHDAANPSKYFPLRIYACLPLYHGTCLFTGLYPAVGSSGTLCLARKFSASNFSRDLVESRATRTLYVGELCRYLLRAPPSPNDKAHKVIVAGGNGLAKDVWIAFKERFNIPEIREFYRSTEGIAKFDNRNTVSDRRGAGHVGYQGPIRRYFEDETFLVKYDPDTEQPWRDPATGFCRTVGANEPGEAIGRIKNMALYLEYLDNKKANDEKIIRDVFVKGDAFQRMGDLLVRDSAGWVSFLDRTGDTYRWRGENVAAGEVREHISRFPEVVDCSVYAVKLPAYDGQAGAVGLTLKSPSASASVESASSSGLEEEAKFIKDFYRRLRKSGLTVWQVPRLVRIMEQIDTGSTFKHAKEVLKKRSWDPVAPAGAGGVGSGVEGAADRLYWLNGEQYVPLQSADWKEIEAGRARL